MQGFTPLTIVLNGDNCWPELKERGFIQGVFVALARLPNGTVGGRSSVMARIETDSGQVVLAETTLALLRSAVQAFDAADSITDLSRVVREQ